MPDSELITLYAYPTIHNEKVQTFQTYIVRFKTYTDLT